MLLLGGNPQIAKGHGDAPVQAYIAAMPGWKRGVAAASTRSSRANVPDVRKAVSLNSPFYGAMAQERTLGSAVALRLTGVTIRLARRLEAEVALLVGATGETAIS